MLDECSGLIHEFDAKKDKVSETAVDVVTSEDCKPVPRRLPVGRIIADIGEKESELENTLEEIEVCSKKYTEVPVPEENPFEQLYSIEY